MILGAHGHTTGNLPLFLIRLAIPIWRCIYNRTRRSRFEMPLRQAKSSQKWGQMVRGVGAFTTPTSTMMAERQWPLGSTSAATSPCSTIWDRDGAGRRREREAQAHLHACTRACIPPALALPTSADL